MNQSAAVRHGGRSHKRLYVILAVLMSIVVIADAWLVFGDDSGPEASAPPPAGTRQTSSAQARQSGLDVVFVDDFDGPANTPVDRNNWIYDLGHGFEGGPENWGTGEVEEMTDSTDNVSLDGDGHLAITPLRDAAGNWTSGRIESKRSDFEAPENGRMRIEASIKLSQVTGAEATGYWQQFWAVGDGARATGSDAAWPGIGEWDILHTVNGRPSTFHVLHCGVAPGGPCDEYDGHGSGEKACPTCGDGFHTYAIEYDRGSSPETLTWSIDGRTVFRATSDEIGKQAWEDATHHGMLVVLNVAMGGGLAGAFGGKTPTDATKSGQPMVVDYVSVMQGAGR